MANLTKIQPEPEFRDCSYELEWLSKHKNGGLHDYQSSDLIRLLIHKVNELTDEVNELKKRGL